MMIRLSNHEAARLKLHILSEGISFDEAFLKHFANDLSSMEKRRAYDDTDDQYLDRTVRIPQELYLNEVVVAVNHKRQSPWRLLYRDNTYRLVGKNNIDVEVTFPRRPRFFEQVTPSGIRCDRIANLYGGSSLAFFTPATCYYFNEGHECRFCSLKPNRSSQQTFVSAINPALAASVLKIAVATDADLLKQSMLVGGNLPDYNKGFRRHLEIAMALDEVQSSFPSTRPLETHIATMPPDDFGLFADLNALNARLTMNLEIFDEQLFEEICPGKAQLYGRHRLMQALERAASVISGKRVHSVLIAGLEPVSSTIAGMNYLASIGVTPIINVFHNDRGSHYQEHARPPYEDLLEVAIALQDVYKKYGLTPYWKGCGRNALDFEALQGWFA
ncbi:MAG TPA: radical SAM protein [Ktedonobacteraceae bacterium]|nr:radical SAM protein [Ktedonobacteraceae bacterium]